LRAGGDAAANISPDLATSLFAAEADDAVTARSPNDDGEVVAVLTEIRPADVAAAEAEVKLVQEALARDIGVDLYDQFIAALRAKIDVSTNQSVVDSLYQ